MQGLSLLPRRGVECDPRLCASAARSPGPCALTVLTSFYLRAGAAAVLPCPPSPTPRVRPASAAPLSLLGLFRKHWELRFLWNCSVFSIIRPVETDTSRGGVCMWPGAGGGGVWGGGPGTSRFGLQAGLICILVDHF